MTTPQPENTTYRILRLTTEGWTLADDQAVNLSKERCDAILQNYVQMEELIRQNSEQLKKPNPHNPRIAL